MRLADEMNKTLAGAKLAYRATWVPAADPEIEDDSIEVGLPDQPSILEVQLGGRYAIINRMHYKAGNLHSLEALTTLRRGDWLAIIAAVLAALAGVSAAVGATATPAVLASAARAAASTEAEARGVRADVMVAGRERKECTYPRCKCIVQTSTSQPAPTCPQGLAR